MLFEALAFWDRVAFIVPSAHFDRRRWEHQDRELTRAMNTALDRFTSSIVPSSETRSAAHELVKDALTQLEPDRVFRGKRTIGKMALYVDKIDTLTLDLLLTFGWLNETNDDIASIRRFVDDKLSGRDDAEAPDLRIIIPKCLGNFLLSAIAEVCCSEDMPPVACDEYVFKEYVDGILGPKMLCRTNSAGSGFARVDEYRHELTNLRYLLAAVPRLGFDFTRMSSTRVFSKMAASLGKDHVRQHQEAFRNRVHDYLRQLRESHRDQQADIVESFRDSAERDINMLKGELGLLSFDEVILKEGIVGMGLGFAAGSLDLSNQPIATVAGAALGLLRGMRTQRAKRNATQKSHWTSWAFLSQKSRFPKRFRPSEKLYIDDEL